MFQNFSMGLTQQYQSVYITLLGADPLQLGFATSIGGLVNAFVTIPSGYLANRYGIGKVLLSSLLIMASGYALFGLTQGWLLTTAGIAIVSVGWGASMVACPLICGNCLRSEERATGMQICDTISAVPRLIAPIIAAFIITLFGGLSVRGIRPLYWLEVIGLLASSIIIFRFFRDPVRDRSENVSSLREEMKRVFNEGVMVKRWLFYIVVSTLPIYMAIYIPLYAKQFKGADQYILGLMDAAYWLTIVILALPTGIWANVYTTPAQDIIAWLDRAGIRKYIKYVISSFDIGYRKPDPRFFSKALAQCGYKKEEVVFIGNQLNTDILGSNNFGIKNIWLSDTSYRSKDETKTIAEVQPTYTISTLLDLPKLLETIQKN